MFVKNMSFLRQGNFYFYMKMFMVVTQSFLISVTFYFGGWSGGAMVLGKLPVPGRPTIRITVGQGPTALAVGAAGGWFGHFYSHLSFLSSFSLSLGDGPI